MTFNLTTAKLISFETWMADCSARIQQGLSYYLEKCNYPAPKLQEAMAYASLSGGKQLRPLLIYATGKVFEVPLESLDVAAYAVELIHSYSLVHDDLPAMDNATWRRGKPSCYKAFGEDIAILAGDALQALAFDIIASHQAPLSAQKRLKMVQILSRASGPLGMVSGQALDILNTAERTSSESALRQMYQLKTGALIQASIELGLAAAEQKTRKQEKALQIYAESISLGFQIQDDILDIEGQTEEIGKTSGLDAEQAKKTYPRLIGLEVAKQKVEHLFQNAFQALEFFDERAEVLRQLTVYMSSRKK